MNRMGYTAARSPIHWTYRLLFCFSVQAFSQDLSHRSLTRTQEAEKEERKGPHRRFGEISSNTTVGSAADRNIFHAGHTFSRTTFLPIGKLTKAATELAVVHQIPLDSDTVGICRADLLGFSLYSDNNWAGRLIVTEDDPNKDSIPRLSRTSHVASFCNDRHGT